MTARPIRRPRLHLLLASCAGLATAASAADLPRSDQPIAVAAGRIEDAAQALQQDAAQYASDHGVTQTEAAAELSALDASVAETDRLAAVYTERLAGIVVEHRPALQIVVLLAGDAPVVAEPAGGPVPIVVRTGASATRGQLLNAIALHRFDLRAALTSAPGFGVDARTGRLAVIVQPGELALEGETALGARLEEIAKVPVEVRT